MVMLYVLVEIKVDFGEDFKDFYLIVKVFNDD